MSSYEIAAACQLDHQTILLTERIALRKLRKRLPKEVRAQFYELLRHKTDKE